MSELQIYFAAAVRGDASADKLQRRVEALEAIGNVLTKHMASPATVDLGLGDREIHDHDLELLARCDVFIADLSSPSTGAGYMAARAVAANKPALCLFRAGQKPSAMIAGSTGVTTRFYDDDAGFVGAVRAFLLEHAAAFADRAFRGRRIYLAGPPGSGKGTLGAQLAVATGAAHVSTGALLRELVAAGTHPQAPAIARWMAAGEIVPADVMRDIVIERLRRPDCKMFGVILDGYPPSLADLANLRDCGIEPDVVFYLAISDATSIARQVGRGARSTDTADTAAKRVTTFHRAGADYEALATEWYPDRIVVRVDAEQPIELVERFARECLRNLFGDPRRDRSYFVLPGGTPRSTRVHFHVDAEDAEAVRAILRDVYAHCKHAQGQIKLYPIESLHLGPQIAQLATYRRMPNYHPIEHSDSEAFATGRLGDGDVEIMRAVLDATRAHGGMAELEEYIGEWILDGDRIQAVTFPELTLLPLEPGLPEIPALELHHGFDVSKADHPALPIPLAELVDACAQAGITNGGWFIFKNPDHWAYRCNEFATEPIATAAARLHDQAKALQAILAARGFAVPIGYSLEKVHGIWVF